MADGKRPTGGPKIPVATPNVGGPVNAAVPLEVALVGCIGARIRLTTTTNTTHEGTLFTADPLTNIIAINTAPPPPTPASASTSPQPGDYHIIPISKLQSFQLLSLAPRMANPSSSAGTPSSGPNFENAVPSIRPIDVRALRQRERNALEAERRKEQSRGRGVPKEAQEIYDALGRTLPVRWNEQNIMVLDSIVIAPPYCVEDCHATDKQAGAALQRVAKVLEMERKKIALRADAKVAIPNMPAPARKGG
ncbi:MAG: hypothetical protein M1817_002108 [Caeruleum heppii]|nr:MAG: hypothetical protein M1817_002108 [Caeruleum heppii]